MKTLSKGVCAGDGAEVVIVVDGQQVAMHVRIANGHLGVGDVVGVHGELVKVFEPPRLLAVPERTLNSAPN